MYNLHIGATWIYNHGREGSVKNYLRKNFNLKVVMLTIIDSP